MRSKLEPARSRVTSGRTASSLLLAGLGVLAGLGLVVAAATPAGAATTARPAGAEDDQATWLVTSSPLRVGDTEYDHPPWPPALNPADSRGSTWLVFQDDLSLQLVSNDDIPLENFPSTDPLPPIHAVLARALDASWHATVFIEDAIFAAAPGGPYTPSCAGLDTVVDTLGGGGEALDFECVDFKAGILVPPAPDGPQDAYTFTGLGGFERDSSVELATGASAPSLTFGVFQPPTPPVELPPPVVIPVPDGGWTPGAGTRSGDGTVATDAPGGGGGSGLLLAAAVVGFLLIGAFAATSGRRRRT